MGAFTTAFTGFFFETACDVLKEIVKAAIEKKMNKIAEEQVRQILFEYLQKQTPSQQFNFQIEKIDILLQEVYSIANATNELEVKGNAIEIQHAPLIKIPETFREMQIRQKVRNLRSEIMEVVEQDVTSEQNARLEEPRQWPSEQPLMFEDVKPVQPIQQSNTNLRNVDEIARDYKKRIQTVINDEEGM